MNLFLNRRLSHLTFRYILDRLAVMYDESRHPDHPWLTASAVNTLNSLLRPSDVGVEFGSGRSTKWFARRLSHLTSIENNPVWFNKISEELATLKIGAVDYRLCISDEDYEAQASTFEDDSIDFCLIDGAVRDRCALMMLPKISRGGLIVVDNVNWFLPNDQTRSPDSRRSSQGCATAVWQEFTEQVSDFRKIWTSNGVADTAIWIKP